MTINKVRLSSIIVIVPLLVVFVIGIYFIQNIWSSYIQTLDLQKHLNKTELYQSLEESVTQEIICATIMSANQKRLKAECQKDRDATDLIANQLGQQSNDISLIERINTLFFDTNKSSAPKVKLFEDVHIANTLENIRYNIDVDESLGLSIFLNGEYHRKILHPIQSYWDKVSSYGTNENKPYLTFFRDMSKLYTNATNEEILVVYFLVNEKSFLSTDLARWDNYIRQSAVPDIVKYNYITPIRKDLDRVFLSKKTDDIISKLDSMRIDILLDYTDARYSTTTKDWVATIQEKQNLFKKSKKDTLQFLSAKLADNIQSKESVLLVNIVVIILSLLFILIVLVRNYIVSRGEDKALEEMMSEVNILTSKSRDEITESVGSLEDLSDKKKIYSYFCSIIKLLQEKELIAEEANIAKDLFLANMSHEIRTPLNGIVGFAQLLKGTDLSSDQKEFVDIIVDSSDNLLGIVNDILDFSKINANKMDLEYISFDICGKLESSVETFASGADEKKIDLGISINPDIPSKVFGDPIKLSQVLTNLISNAIKFTPIGGEISFHMDIVKDEENYTTVKFAVKDSGIGISKEKRKSIFQAFSQEDSGTSRKYGGTGLGLTISSNIVKLMGGELDVADIEGGGSCFFFTLRLEKDLQSIKDMNDKEDVVCSNLSVGFVSPLLSTKSQSYNNLKLYVEHMGASFQHNTYDQLFSKTEKMEVPDILFLDHHYESKADGLEKFAILNIPIVLMTTGRMKQLVDLSKYSYIKTIQKPITKRKIMQIMHENIYAKDSLNNPNEETSLPMAHFNKINALVAEDNVINQKLILRTLERFGLVVTLVSNGFEAFEARKNAKFDIIFMDIQMPVMNGMEATEKILEHEKRYGLDHVPIIALTANALKGDREKYMKIGMDGYVYKPLNLSEIKNIIEKFLPDNISNQTKIDVLQELDTREDADGIEVIKKEKSQIGNIEKGELTNTTKAEYKAVLLYCKHRLEQAIYAAILKRSGYEIATADSMEEFIDLIENYLFTYAMYDYSCIHGDLCKVAQKARDEGVVPLVFIEKEDDDTDICASTIRAGDNKDMILSKMKEAQ